MAHGIAAARRAGIPVEYRALLATSVIEFERDNPDIRVDIHAPWRDACDRVAETRRRYEALEA